MTKYQLAKLVQWAGGIDTRKRMQKLVYMLQAAGCKFEADYFLHRYGPYSTDVARLTDELVADGVLEESQTANQVGHQYSYRMTDRGNELLRHFEQKKRSSGLLVENSKYETLAEDLAKQDLRELEVASTIAYYYFEKQLDWENASESAFEFKGVKNKSDFAVRTLALAKKVESI